MRYLLLFLILTVSLFAQHLKEDETRFRTVQANIRETEQRLTQSQQRLTLFLSETDSLKSALADAGLLTQRTAQAYEYAKEIESLRSQLKKLQSQSRTLRSRLYQIYSTKIDSLNKEMETHPKNKRLRRQLFWTMTKRLNVSPVAESFRFNPLQIGQIDSTVLKDRLGKEIVRSYLEQADSSLSKKIEELQKKEQEMQQIIALRNKAADFVDEMDETRMTSYHSGNGETKTSDASTYAGEDGRIGTSVKDMANRQSESYFLLMHFLETGTMTKDNSSQLLDYPELLKRLSQTRLFLQQYQKQIRLKLHSIRKP